jgi:hypothetical protein
LSPLRRAEFPLYPPGAWFDTMPDWFQPGDKLAFQTDGADAGRVAATVAPRDQCILDGTSDCWTVPYSPTNYTAAQQGDTMTAEGSLIHTANIGGGTNHARMSANFRGAVEHYQNTASQLMRVRYHDLDGHVIALGALWPDVTELDLAIVRASAVSGDWRYRPELAAIDMTGSCLVNTPGFPLMTRRMARAAGLGWIVDPDGELPAVYVGGLGGIGEFEPETAACPMCGHDEARVHDLEVLTAALVEAIGPDAVRAALTR